MTFLNITVWFWIVLALVGLLAVASVGYVALLDRAERYRLGQQSIPAAMELPMCVARPTAYRNQREKARARKREQKGQTQT